MSAAPILAAALVGSAALVWIAGAPLARSTDALSDRLGLGEAAGGLLLLAVATNLPEVAIVLSAALRGDLSLAVGDILGGIAAQTAVLVAIDRWGVRTGAPLATRASTPPLQIEALLVVAIMAATVLGALASGTRWGRFGPGDLLVPAVWIAGVALVMRVRAKPIAKGATDVPTPAAGAAATFAVASLATLAGGVGLEWAGDGLADLLGMNGVLFGATVLAAATSLPELTTGIAAARAGQFELAASDILGGNAFLPVLLAGASAVAGVSAFGSVDPTGIAMCMTGALMTVAVASALALRPSRRIGGVGPEAWPMLAAYGIGIAAIAAIG